MRGPARNIRRQGHVSLTPCVSTVQSDSPGLLRDAEHLPDVDQVWVSQVVDPRQCIR